MCTNFYRQLCNLAEIETRTQEKGSRTYACTLLETTCDVHVQSVIFPNRYIALNSLIALRALSGS